MCVCVRVKDSSQFRVQSTWLSGKSVLFSPKPQNSSVQIQFTTAKKNQSTLGFYCGSPQKSSATLTISAEKCTHPQDYSYSLHRIQRQGLCYTWLHWYGLDLMPEGKAAPSLLHQRTLAALRRTRHAGSAYWLALEHQTLCVQDPLNQSRLSICLLFVHSSWKMRTTVWHRTSCDGTIAYAHAAMSMLK